MSDLIADLGLTAYKCSHCRRDHVRVNPSWTGLCPFCCQMIWRPIPLDEETRP